MNATITEQLTKIENELLPAIEQQLVSQFNTEQRAQWDALDRRVQLVNLFISILPPDVQELIVLGAKAKESQRVADQFTGQYL